MPPTSHHVPVYGGPFAPPNQFASFLDPDAETGLGSDVVKYVT